MDIVGFEKLLSDADVWIIFVETFLSDVEYLGVGDVRWNTYSMGIQFLPTDGDIDIVEVPTEEWMGFYHSFCDKI